MKQYIDKYILLFTKPALFFKDAAKEKEYWPILLYVAVLSFIGSFLGFLLTLPIFVGPTLTGTLLNSALNIVLIFFSPLLVIILSFVSAGIAHLGVLFFHGKEEYFTTWKVITYGGLINVTYSLLISVIFSVGEILSPPQQSLFAPQQVFGVYSITLMILFFIIGIIGLVHRLYTSVQGLSQYHKLSKGSALLCSLLPLVVFILVMIAFAMIFVAPLMTTLSGSVN